MWGRYVGQVRGAETTVNQENLGTPPKITGSAESPAAPANLPIAKSLPSKVRGPMPPSMAATFLRLMMLVAHAIMPFGMAGAPAAALPSTAAASGGHCDDHQKPADGPSTPKAHCAVCAALPAGDTSMAVSELRLVLLRVVQAEQWLAEQEPDIDTPPPKLG